MVHTIIDHLHVLSCAVGKAASCEPFVAVIVAAAVERAKLPRSDPDSMAPQGRQEPSCSRRPQNGYAQLDGRRAAPGRGSATSVGCSATRGGQRRRWRCSRWQPFKPMSGTVT